MTLCHYAENHCAECCHLFIVMLNVIMLSVIIMLSVVMLSAVMLNVIMLNVIMLNVIMLNVVTLNVVMLNVVMLNVVMLSVMSPVLISAWPRFTATKFSVEFAPMIISNIFWILLKNSAIKNEFKINQKTKRHGQKKWKNK